MNDGFDTTNSSGLAVDSKWDSEIIIPCKYIEMKEWQTGCIPGVAYLKDGKPVTKLVLGTERNVSVQLFSDVQEGITFAIHHVFIGRYIKYVLKAREEDVEIFRFGIFHGNGFLDNSELETGNDLPGEIVSEFKETTGALCRFSFEHISGPFLADIQLLISQFTANRLTEISGAVTENLILDRRSYLANPKDLPMLGVIAEADEVTTNQRMFEDMLLRDKEPKKKFLN